MRRARTGLPAKLIFPNRRAARSPTDNAAQPRCGGIYRRSSPDREERPARAGKSKQARWKEAAAACPSASQPRKGGMPCQQFVQNRPERINVGCRTNFVGPPMRLLGRHIAGRADKGGVVSRIGGLLAEDLRQAEIPVTLTSSFSHPLRSGYLRASNRGERSRAHAPIAPHRPSSINNSAAARGDHGLPSRRLASDPPWTSSIAMYGNPSCSP